ncbi:MAG: sugar phosphate isomerase/epimerase [Spirochaetaceae bacterium]|nr:sugar phosphate isomerase/epimerase [Spirochaetaceae bacterium]
MLSHDDSLTLIAMLGLTGVDIGLFEDRSHLYPSHVLADPRASSAELVARVTGKGLAIADIFLQTAGFDTMTVNHPDAAERRGSRDLFERTLEFVQLCETGHMTILPGIEFDGESAETSLARAAEELSWRLERAAGTGVTVSVEAHVGSIVPNPDAALRLVEMTPGLTLTLDYTHFTRDGLPDSESEKLVPHASHFHARGAAEGRLQVKFTENVIDYADVLRALDAADYRGWVGVEYVWQDWERNNEVDNVSETILMRDFLLANSP